MKEFSKILLEELHKRGITPTALGRAVDISPSAMSNYKKGRIPKSDELLRIAEFLEVPMEYLLTGKIYDRPGGQSPRVEEREISIPDQGDLDEVIDRIEGTLDALRAFRKSFEIEPDSNPKSEPENIVEIDRNPITTELPYYGKVAAGEPSAVDFYGDETRIVPGDFRNRPHYLLQVHGESMEPNFRDGSYVVVRALEPGEYPRKGDVVVADDGTGPCMKMLEYRKSGPKTDTPRKPSAHLVSINPNFNEIIPVIDTPIQGIVVDSFDPDFF